MPSVQEIYGKTVSTLPEAERIPSIVTAGSD